jgi:putrescine aminotransferase
MFGAVELVKDKDNYIKFDKQAGIGTICRDFCLENNLVMRAVGDAMIISPPLVIEQADIDVFVERAWKCLDLTQKAIA